MTNLVQGLKREQMIASAFSGGTAAFSAQEIGAAELASGTIVRAHMAYGYLGTGSPSAFGNSVQFGSTTVTGSPAATGWVVFGTGFKAAPTAIIHDIVNSSVSVAVASVNAGSAQVTYAAATYTGTVAWIAVGSGY